MIYFGLFFLYAELFFEEFEIFEFLFCVLIISCVRSWLRGFLGTAVREVEECVVRKINSGWVRYAVIGFKIREGLVLFGFEILGRGGW